MTAVARSLPPELAPYAQALEDFNLETGIQLLLPPLGTGGGGTVLKAHTSAGKQLAIKVIAAEDAASRDQALREASILKQVQQARPFGGGEGLLWQKRTQQADLFFLAMDFIEGQTLTELIAARGPLAEPVAIELAIGIAEELEALHHQHIIHRDVKPDNVMLLKLGKHYQPIVVDYGIAKVGKKTMRGARAATDGYAPPEQYHGGTDCRTDVYALGATLYEMVTGLTPLPSPNRDPEDVLELRQYAPKLSRGLELIIQIATAYQSQQRFSNMGMMLDALRLARDGNEAALHSTLQALGLPSGTEKQLKNSGSLSAAVVPTLPPLPMKSSVPRPKAPKLPASVRDKVCPYCHEPFQAGEAFCSDCGGALDPAVSVLSLPAPRAVAVVASNPKDASAETPRTPGPQFVSLVLTNQIVLGGPALGWLGKNLLLITYWLLLAGAALGARSLSIACSLVSGVTIAFGVGFFLLFPLFAYILSHWDDLIITRRGQAHWLRRSGLLLLGLGGLGGVLYWLVSEVRIWQTAWFLNPPPLSMLIYMGLVCFASISIKALLA